MVPKKVDILIQQTWCFAHPGYLSYRQQRGGRGSLDPFFFCGEWRTCHQRKPDVTIASPHFGTHWTADVELMEHRRRQALSRHLRGILVVSALRMMALLVLAVARQLSRLGYSAEWPSWSDVIQHFFLRLCNGILKTKAVYTV